VILLRQYIASLTLAGILPKACAVLPETKLVGKVFKCPEFRRRRMAVGEILGFDMRAFNEYAPHWRKHEVKRGSLLAWEPDWLSERMEANVDWHSPAAEPFAALEGKLEPGAVGDGVVFWLEASGVELDPRHLLVAGIITPEEPIQLQASEAEGLPGPACVALRFVAEDPMAPNCLVVVEAARPVP